MVGQDALSAVHARPLLGLTPGVRALYLGDRAQYGAEASIRLPPIAPISPRLRSFRAQIHQLTAYSASLCRSNTVLPLRYFEAKIRLDIGRPELFFKRASSGREIAEDCAGVVFPIVRRNDYWASKATENPGNKGAKTPGTCTIFGRCKKATTPASFSL